MAEETQTFPTLDPAQRAKSVLLLIMTIGCAVLFALAVFVATTIPPLASHLAVALLAFRPRLPVSPVLYRALVVGVAIIGTVVFALFGAGIVWVAVFFVRLCLLILRARRHHAAAAPLTH